jgi:hypothetical protein
VLEHQAVGAGVEGGARRVADDLDVLELQPAEQVEAEALRAQVETRLLAGALEDGAAEPGGVVVERQDDRGGGDDDDEDGEHDQSSLAHRGSSGK